MSDSKNYIGKAYGYIRVSTEDQNLDRQIDEMGKLGIPENRIYSDKSSGKDFERVSYQYLKKVLEEGDTLVIKSLDRLGRNRTEVKKEWESVINRKINIRVLDMPILNRKYVKGDPVNELIHNLVFEIISWVDEEQRRRIKESQKEGIAAAKKRGKHLGRPKLNLNSLSEEKVQKLQYLYPVWKSNDITAVHFAKELELKKSSFYKLIKQYEEELNNIT